MNHQNASVVSDNMHFVNFASTRRYFPKQAELSDDPKAQRQQYKQQMTGLLHGSFTPAGISCGRPHCVILLPGRAVAERKYHYPCRDPCETVRHGLLFGQTLPLVILDPILFTENLSADESWRGHRCRLPFSQATAVNVFSCWI